MSYSKDPRWIVSRYDGQDANGVPFKRGARVFYYPNGKKILTGQAAEQASRDFDAARADEEQF